MQSTIDAADFDGTVVDEVLTKVCMIQSVVEVIDPRTVTIDSKVDLIDAEVEQVQLIANTIESKVCVIDSKIDNIMLCTSITVTAATTITSPGSYCMANDIAGVLTIDSPRVVFDMNGHQILGGIALTGSASEIFIMNGFIDGGGGTIGIDIATAAVTDIHISNVTITGATVGISATVAVSRLLISDIVVTGSSMFFNLRLTGCDNVIIENSVFNGSLGIGAVLSSCIHVEIHNCFFNLNSTMGLSLGGLGTNTRVIGSTFNANGADGVSSFGACMEFIECRAEANAMNGFELIGSDILCEGCFACLNDTGFAAESTGSGIFKENLAVGNVTCGFNDVVGGGTGWAYLANAAQGNAGGVGAGNYCIAGVPVALATPPFAQVAPPGVSFWNNISV